MSLATAFLAELTDADLDALAELLAPRIQARREEQQQPEPWLTTEQAAAHLGISKSQLYQTVHKRHSTAIPVHKHGSRSYFKATELDAWRSAQGNNS